MKKNDDYYRQVEEEIKQGKYQEGLRTRAIAEADGDENKARALYIKLRVESLKTEAAEAIRDAQEQKELRHLAELNSQLENMSHIIRRRRIIRIGGVIVGFTVGIVIGIVGKYDFLNLLFFGAIFALVGYGPAIIYRYCIPSQRYLNKIEDEKKYLSMSPTNRFLKRWGWGLFFGLYILIHLLRWLRVIP
jgi:hypothetical protein